MTALPALLLLAVAAVGDHSLDAGNLPVCGNRVINAVVKRSGCTLGDARCWARSGGFCTDYVGRRIGKGRSPDMARAEVVAPEKVRAGDVAVFSSRAHYAYVEKVTRDGQGRPVTLDLSEFNFGTCWVDRELMVTDQYGLKNVRSGVVLGDVDGGFLRPRPTAR